MFLGTRVPSRYWISWLLLCSYFAVGDAFVDNSAGYLTLLLLNLTQNINWGVLGILCFHLADRYPIRSRKDWHRVLGHGLMAAFMALLAVTWAFLVLHAYYYFRFHAFPFLTWVYNANGALHASSFWGAWLRYAVRWYHVNLFVLGAITWGYHWYRLKENLRNKEMEAARMEVRFHQAQVQALRSQLQPHFLFNALNSVSALVHQDPEAADRMLSRLGDFLRLTLEWEPKPMVNLDEEMAFLRTYLEIEKIRFQDRLHVTLDVPEGLKAHKIPALLLQPLVENAIKHGLARNGGGSLLVRVREASGSLVLEVQDDGAGLHDSAREGVGLSNTRQRLRLAYGENAFFELRSVPVRGTIASIYLPLSGPLA